MTASIFISSFDLSEETINEVRDIYNREFLND